MMHLGEPDSKAAGLFISKTRPLHNFILSEMARYLIQKALAR